MPKAVDIKLEKREIIHPRGVIYAGKHHAQGAVIEVSPEVAVHMADRGLIALEAKKVETRTVNSKRPGRPRKNAKTAKKAAAKPAPVKKPAPVTMDMTMTESRNTDITAEVMPVPSPKAETVGLSPDPEPSVKDPIAPPLEESRSADKKTVKHGNVSKDAEDVAKAKAEAKAAAATKGE